MMNQINSYQEELQNLHHRRIYYIILVGSLMTLCFGFLDSVIAPEFSQEFFFYRILTVSLGIFLFIANYRDKKKQYSLLIGFIGYLCVALSLLKMIYYMGGAASPYFVGLIVTMTIYTALAPLTMLQTLISGFSLVACYVITLLLAGSIASQNLIDLFTNLYFIVCFVFIASTQSWTDTAARRNEFRLRQQENEIANELSGHAALLEQEVDKRSREQAASEKQYRLLFNQIADDVAVVTPEGKIIQSNDSFAHHYTGRLSNEEQSFFDIIPLSERQNTKNVLTDLVSSGQSLSAFQLSVIKKDGKEMQVEINGTLLKRDTASAGILLVIRDISIRKFLDQRLVESLKIKKQTESSTILALAKLSEYREITPINHLERIREYCKALATELSGNKDLMETVTPSYIQDIYHASILHDIGKVAIPDKLLNKTSPLTRQEKETIRQHTLIGGNVIKEMEENQGSGFLSIAKQIAYFHHEHWDGKGYPYGLQGKEIPLAARILTLADAYEELTATPNNTTKPYSHEEAVQSIIAKSGFQFDSLIVEAFLTRQDEFNDIRQKLSFISG